jgi:hypothetical protein
MKKVIIYKGLFFVFCLIYLLFSIYFLEGTGITYNSISYWFLNSMMSIFDYLRVLCYILLFINMILILIISIRLILNKKIKSLSIIFCIFHLSVGIFYCMAYKDLSNLILGIIPVVGYIFLYIIYNGNLNKI